MKLTQTIAFEKLSVGSGAAVGFTATVYHSATVVGLNAWSAYVTVETTDIRYRTDGTAPTSTTGHVAAAGTGFEIFGEQDVKRFSSITASGTSTLQVTYGK